MKYLALVLCFVSSLSFGQTVTCTGTNDTSAINSAISTYNRVFLEGDTCAVTSINATGRLGTIIEGAGPFHTKIVPITGATNLIDGVGSSNLNIKNLRVYAACSGPVPSTGILSAQSQGSAAADSLHIDNVRVDGCFSLASVFVFGTQSSAVNFSQFYNYSPGAFTVVMTGNNFFGALSSYIQIKTVNDMAVSDWTFTATEMHNFGNGWGLWIGGGTSLRFYGGNVSSQHPLVSLNSVVLTYGTVNPANIIFDGTTFYGDELTHISPACVLSGITGSATLRANDTAGIPLTASGC